MKPYLSTIITRLALDYLKSARVTREQYIGAWLPEPILTSVDGGFSPVDFEQQEGEALSLAFLRLFESLSPPERAVFLLHEVFDYPFSDIGVMLEKSPANCRQIFHRARQALQEKRARFAPEPQRQRQLLLQLSLRQSGRGYGGSDQPSGSGCRLLVGWWRQSAGEPPADLLPASRGAAWSFWMSVGRKNQPPLTDTQAEINGSPALLFWDEGRLAVVISLTVSAAGIQEIYALLNPDKLAYLQKQLSISSAADITWAR